MQREASILIKLYGRISDLDAAFKVGIAETDGDFELLFRMFVWVTAQDSWRLKFTASID